MKSKNLYALFLMLVASLLLASCGSQPDTPKKETEKPAQTVNTNDPMNNKGVGPVTNVVLGDIDPAMVAEGEQLFKQMCSACHKPDQKLIGPAPKGILKRRSPEWIMNMILAPDKMVLQDPIAKQLLVESNLAPMANQNLTEEQARKILEYFRTLE
ncbi:MAG TPA: c-type cytochrome [Bacteroidales bacterium]|nr:c-type cytochrome [Bacteroidales bacterium]